MRRAAVSVPANDRRGIQAARPCSKAHFYNIAQASLEEIRYYIILCRDLGYTIAEMGMAEQADQV